jgi:agmatinase
MHPVDELALLLRPAAGGVYLVSTGRAEQLALQRALYGATDDADVDRRFHAGLAALADARGLLLAVPSDVGAGFRRGASLGPQAIRERLLADDPRWPDACRARGLVDLGDVFVVPQLLHDSMLSEAQLAASRRALYPNVSPADAAALPVSPLSIAERALDLIFAINPRLAPFILGGDHSVAWPVVAALHRARRMPWGIVQIDAHTDLLAERLGIKYCFATWSFHANDLLGRGGKLVQVGIRATRHPRSHWEDTLDVRQFWAEACRRDPAAALDEIVAAVKASGAGAIYFSNDIDGTDAIWADATGTPEPDGLTPDFVLALIARLGAEVGLLGGDVVEVAPPLLAKPDSAERTVGLACRYLRATIDATLGPAA